MRDCSRDSEFVVNSDAQQYVMYGYTSFMLGRAMFLGEIIGFGIDKRRIKVPLPVLADERFHPDRSGV